MKAATILRGPRNLRWLGIGLPVLGLIVAAAIWGVVVWVLQVERQRVIDETRGRVQDLTQGFEAYVHRAVSHVDQITRFVAQSQESGARSAPLLQQVRNDLVAQPGLVGVWIADAVGHVQGSAGSEFPPNVAKAEYFAVHGDGRHRGLFISKPVQGPPGHPWVVMLSRRLHTSDGAFAGVVMVSVDPAYFTAFYNERQLGQQGFVSLVGLDGVTRARRSGSGSLQQETLGAFTGQLPRVDGDTPLERITHDQSRKVLDDYPLAVQAGLSVTEALVGDDTHRQHLMGLAGAATVLLLLVVGVMTALGARLLRSQAEVQQAKARFEAASDAALDALYILSAVRDANGAIVDFRFEHCNERGARLIDRSKAQVVGQRLIELLPANRDERFFGRYCQVVTSRQPLEDEFFVELEGIGRFWLHHQVVPVGDGIAITSRDVTNARRREQEMQSAHQAVHDSEKRLRDVTDNLPALIAYIDQDSRYRFSNAKYKTWLGVEPATMSGRTVAEVFGPEVDARTRADLARAFGGERVQAERHVVWLGRAAHYL